MSLTLRNGKQWIIFSLGVFCLSMGMVLCLNYTDDFRNGRTGQAAIEATKFEEIEFGEGTQFEEVELGEGTQFEEVELGEGTQFGGPGLEEGTQFGESGLEEGTQFGESGAEENTQFENIELGDNGNIIKASTDTKYRLILGYLGYALFAIGGVLGILFVGFSIQEHPILGPEAELALLLGMMYFSASVLDTNLAMQLALCFIIPAIMLLSLRGIWCWLRHKCDIFWCLPHRLGVILADGFIYPQRYILVHMLWCIVMVVLSIIFFPVNYWSVLGYVFLFAAVLAICSLWKFGRMLGHLQIQFQNLSEGKSIAVQSGVFEETEQKLLVLQEKQEKAIHTAVTSERFKVELISNVSHDLRTPLTSILGYGELLQQETLSQTGKERLSHLNQKAGYMKELVESLFELTKGSSGVVESKKEEIDLIRLLEQTIGLLDDQLTAAGLLVRRHYEMESLKIVTDGFRMHQVFANLLGNAIKYACPGTRIHLEVKENDTEYLVRMTNTASYEMDFQPEEIMQRFVRGDKARSTKGSGLGLAIAQTYTESVGGQFHVTIDGDQFSAIVTFPKIETNSVPL